MKKFFGWVFLVWAFLGSTGLFLLVARAREWASGEATQNTFYLMVFLVHLVLGVLVLLPTVGGVLAHLARAYRHPNRQAVRAGWTLFGVVLALLISGLVLTRLEGLFVVKNPTAREAAYWTHVASSFLVVVVFVMHRRLGRNLRWRPGVVWLAATVVLIITFQMGASRGRGRPMPEGDPPFSPALARIEPVERISPELLANDAYCRECHRDVHDRWSASAHRLSSFNNPPYSFSVLRTREVGLERDGTVEIARLCAGCHDPVPLFSGRFDDPAFDHVNDPTAGVGITCTVCHSITAVNSPRGNADYTLQAPRHYPFAFSDSKALRWVNRQLVLSKPALHKRTFLKPLHRTPEFCSVCHKVHIPKEVNRYKWLRGQNHYDSFLLSGVSGHGVASFYYPERATETCSDCHMPPQVSDDFGAVRLDGSETRVVHDHLFPAANTALPKLAGLDNSDDVVAAHQRYLEGRVRLDIFGVRRGGGIDGPLVAPLRPELVQLEPGSEYLVEVVIRTLGVGHLLTQGTADSNQLWLDVVVRSDGRIVGRSGAVDDDGLVDPWSHFVNAYVVDRDGRRIDRRNAEDILAPLYDNQIPPGAADVVHYRLQVPEDAADLEIDVALNYRKFDTTFMRLVYGQDFTNDLPVTTLARDRIDLPVAGGSDGAEGQSVSIPEHERWNDYGIGLLRRGELRQAERAFQKVEEQGSAEGPLNLARLYLEEGRVTEEAPLALQRASTMDPPANAWSLLWFGGLVNRQNGRLEDAVRSFQQIVEGGFEQAIGRGFDFSKDYRLLNELAYTLYLQALQERGPNRRARREQILGDAARWFEEVLLLDPENLRAHYSLMRIADDLGDEAGSQRHRLQVERFRPDDNARDRAMVAARLRDPAADHAAERVVIYDLHRDGAEGSPSEEAQVR